MLRSSFTFTGHFHDIKSIYRRIAIKSVTPVTNHYNCDSGIDARRRYGVCALCCDSAYVYEEAGGLMTITVCNKSAPLRTPCQTKFGACRNKREG